jgi:hypothetical protein
MRAGYGLAQNRVKQKRWQERLSDKAAAAIHLLGDAISFPTLSPRKSFSEQGRSVAPFCLSGTVAPWTHPRPDKSLV